MKRFSINCVLTVTIVVIGVTILWLVSTSGIYATTDTAASTYTGDKYSYLVWYDTEYLPVAKYRSTPPCEILNEGSINGFNNQPTAILACKGDLTVPPSIQQIDNFSDFTLWQECHRDDNSSACSTYYNQ